MKKLLFLLITALLSSSLMIGQTGNTVVVLNKTGKIKYGLAPDFKMKRLRSGDILQVNSKVKIKKNASITLFHDGNFKVLSEQGEFALQEVFNQGGGTMLGFASTFSDFLEDGMALEGGGSGGSGGVSTLPPIITRDGWGDKDHAIQPLNPIGGNVVEPVQVFSWRTDDRIQTPSFEFVLEDGKGKTIKKQIVKGNKVSLDLRQLGLSPNESYRFKVLEEGDPATTSPTVTFQFREPKDRQNTVDEVKRDKLYQSIDPCNRLLMEAAKLEKKEFYQDAASKFAQAVKQCPNNKIAKSMQKSFQSRYRLSKM